MDAATRRANFKLIVERRFGNSQSSVAAAIGKSEGRVSQLLDDKQPFGERAARAIEDSLGLRELSLDAPVEGAAAAEDRRHVELENNPDYPAVRRVQFKLSAGVSGYAVEYLDDDGPPIVFRKDWFKTHGYRPEKLLAAIVNGASMEPTLYDGDLVVINTDQPEPIDGRAFALNYEGVMSIKRLVRDGGEWWLRSDNPDKIRFPDKRTHAEVSIIGEIVYRQSERI